MASFNDVTALMGDYMLKGWVLTDKTCTTPACAIPLMRSPRGQSPEIHFCARCHGNPTAAAQASQSASTASSGSSLSRTSTPLTEVSNHEISDDDFEIPPETEQGRMRREQSDRASAELGSRLLKGWAMLGEECPNETCYGVPLVRPPSIGGEKSAQKECVICGNVYLPEGSRLKDDTAPPAFILEDKAGSSLFGAISIGQENPSETLIPFAPLPQLGIAQVSLLPLNITDEALQHSLQTLSASLTSLSNSNPLDVHSLGNTADAISKVVQALGHVKALQWSESRARSV